MSRWTVLVVGPDRTWPVELATGRPTVVGRGKGVSIDTKDATVAERHLSLAVRDEGLVLEALRGAEVLVNDVPVSGQAVLRAGDEVRLGETRLLLSMSPSLPVARPRIASHDEVVSRLEEELARASGHRPVGLVFVAAPALNPAARQALTRRVVEEVARSGVVACWGELAPDVLFAVLPEAPPKTLAALLVRLPDVAGPRARVISAQSPADGLDAEALVGAAWTRLLGEEIDDVEPVLADPVMVRLANLLEGQADAEGAICAVGPPGCGRQTLLEVVVRAAGRKMHVVSAADGEALEASLTARSGAWLLVRELDALPPESIAALAARVGTRLLAVSRSAPPAGVFDVVVEVPPLHARPEDIAPLADAFLSRARGVMARPRLSLGAEARSLLAAWRWPGNVRELKNVLLRAARASVRDEVGRDALPARLTAGAPADDFRGAMKSAERELLLETLARTRWNVTAAAQRLGMPRRTVVFRMAKLGLKRPAR